MADQKAGWRKSVHTRAPPRLRVGRDKPQSAQLFGRSKGPESPGGAPRPASAEATAVSVPAPSCAPDVRTTAGTSPSRRAAPRRTLGSSTLPKPEGQKADGQQPEEQQAGGSPTMVAPSIKTPLSLPPQSGNATAQSVPDGKSPRRRPPPKLKRPVRRPSVLSRIGTPPSLPSQGSGSLERRRAGTFFDPMQTHSTEIKGLMFAILNPLCDLMHLEEATSRRLKQMLEESTAAQKACSEIMLQPEQTEQMTQLKQDAASFYGNHTEVMNVVMMQTAVRMWLARKRLLYIRNNRNPGVCAAWLELVQNEKEYLHRLAMIVDRYFLPLQTSDKHVVQQMAQEVPGTDWKAIFSNVEDLLSLHRFVFSQFELAQRDWPLIENVGLLFMKLAPRFQLYGQYVNNFKIAMDTLNACQVSRSFSQFLEKTQRHGIDLSMLLTFPLNHLSLYERVVREIMKHTSSEAEDYVCLIGALAIMEETTSFIRTALGQADHRAALMRVQRQLAAGAGTRKVNLLSGSASRELLGEVEAVLLSNALQGDAVTARGKMFLCSDLCLVTSMGTQGSRSGRATPRMSTPRSARSDPLFVVEFVFQLETTAVVECSNDTFQLGACKEDGNLDENNSVKVRFAKPATAHEWFRKIQDAVALNQPNRVFGVPLKQLLERENRVECGVPLVVETLVSYLRKNGMSTEGLFRIPGTTSRMSRLRTEFNQIGGGGVDLESRGDAISIHDVAGLLKMFFRDLPEALCLFAFTDDIIRTQTEIDDLNERIDALYEILGKLPPENFRLLGYLVQFLRDVTQNEEVNKMSSANISTCLGPNLIRPEEQTIEYTLSIPKANDAMQLMIDAAEELELIPQS